MVDKRKTERVLKRLNNKTSGKLISKGFEIPNYSGIKKSLNEGPQEFNLTRQSKIQVTPTDPKDIVNKEYVDNNFIQDLSSFTTDDLNQGSTNLYSQWENTATGIKYGNSNEIEVNNKLIIKGSSGSNPVHYWKDEDFSGTHTGTPGVPYDSHTIGSISPWSSTEGGLALKGVSSSSNLGGFLFSGFIGTQSTTMPAIEFRAGRIYGTGIDQITSGYKLYSFRNYFGNVEYMGIWNGKVYFKDKVGVGTTSPQGVLHLRGSSTNELIMEAATGNPDLSLSENGNIKGQVIYDITNNGLSFKADESHTGYGAISGVRFFINGSNGNVGIGTTTPTRKLDVNGSTNIGVNLYVNGESYFYDNIDLNSNDIENVGTINGISINTLNTNLNDHLNDTSNPHNVTRDQLNLGTSDAPTFAGLTLTGNLYTQYNIDGYNIGDVHSSKCEAVQNAGQSFSNNSVTKVNYGAENYDGLNEYDTSTSKFTAQNAGYYIINAGLLYTSGSWASGSNCWLAVYKNGSIAKVMCRWYNTTGATYNGVVHLIGSAQVHLNAGDYIEIKENQTSGSTKNASSASHNIFLNIHRLS